MKLFSNWAITTTDREMVYFTKIMYFYFYITLKDNNRTIFINIVYVVDTNKTNQNYYKLNDLQVRLM